MYNLMHHCADQNGIGTVDAVRVHMCNLMHHCADQNGIGTVDTVAEIMCNLICYFCLLPVGY